LKNFPIYKREWPAYHGSSWHFCLLYLFLYPCVSVLVHYCLPFKSTDIEQ